MESYGFAILDFGARQQRPSNPVTTGSVSDLHFIKDYKTTQEFNECEIRKSCEIVEEGSWHKIYKRIGEHGLVYWYMLVFHDMMGGALSWASLFHHHPDWEKEKLERMENIFKTMEENGTSIGRYNVDWSEGCKVVRDIITDEPKVRIAFSTNIGGPKEFDKRELQLDIPIKEFLAFYKSAGEIMTPEISIE